jgi:16S rRNA (guanine966-N2)-methyltransferase
MPANNQLSPGKIRIIGGNWRGTVLTVTAQQDLRPSGNRLRETLFNWLAGRITGTSCLDLFAGSGALGLEALSRGAATLVSVECHRKTAAQLQKQVDKLHANEQAHIVCADAHDWINKVSGHFDLCFLDPPFDDPHLSESLECIATRQLISDGGLVYLETPAIADTRIPMGWNLYKQSKQGISLGSLYTVSHTSHSKP